jgi:hypothetical protein
MNKFIPVSGVIIAVYSKSNAKQNKQYGQIYFLFSGVEVLRTAINQ